MQELQIADLQAKFDAGQYLDVLCPILVNLREKVDCHSSIYELASIAFIAALRAANKKNRLQESNGLRGSLVKI